ncbi:MAG: hypothetical protein HXX11_02040 [Desulfuromonadales bacterium]|nr:hypothetical protein [Desulfuromonadales bacterium]
MKTGLPFITHLLLGTLLLAASLSGCATIDQKIDLSYSPIDRAFGRQSESIVVARANSAPAVRNSRGEWIVGALNNVHGVHKADLLADRNQGEWVTDALLLELKHAGFNATYKDPLPVGATLGIQLSDITSFMNVNRDLFNTEVKQELKFTVDIFQNGSRVKTFAVASRTSQTVALIASADENAKIMLQALQDAMQQVMSEVHAQTQKK